MNEWNWILEQRKVDIYVFVCTYVYDVNPFVCMCPVPIHNISGKACRYEEWWCLWCNSNNTQNCTPKPFHGCKIGKVCMWYGIYCDKQANGTNENEPKNYKVNRSWQMLRERSLAQQCLCVLYITLYQIVVKCNYMYQGAHTHLHRAFQARIYNISFPSSPQIHF